MFYQSQERSRATVFILFGLLWAWLAWPVLANPLAQWTRSEPKSVHSLASGNGAFVAAGARGLLIWGQASTPAAWARASAHITNDLFAVAFAAGKFVAVGSNGTILESSNSLSKPWAQFRLGNKRWYDVTSASGILIAVGEAGNIAVKRTDAPWTAQRPATPANLHGVAYGNGIWVAVGAEGTVLSSTNSVDWEQTRSSPGVLLKKVAYGNGAFVALVNESGRILRSTDGRSWEMLEILPAGRLHGITFEKELFVSVGERDGRGVILGSAGGTDWFCQTNLATGPLHAVTYEPNISINTTRPVNVWVAIGSNAAAARSINGPIFNLPLPTNWTSVPGYNAADVLWTDVVYGNGTFVSVGQAPYGPTIASSTDGETWTPSRIEDSQSLDGPSVVTGVAYGNNMFLAVGGVFYSGVFHIQSRSTTTSSDGRTWSRMVVSKETRFQSVAYGNGVFVASGSEPGAPKTSRLVIASSPDGITWTTRFQEVVPGFADEMGVAYGDGLFVVAGPGIYTSTNGVDWIRRHGTEASGVAYGNGRFVASARSGILVSSDGVTWVARDVPDLFSRVPPLRTRTTGITFGNGIFLLIGWDTIWWSLDADRWAQHVPIDPQGGLSLKAAAYGAGRFVVVGSMGVAVRSEVVAQFIPKGIRLLQEGSAVLPMQVAPGARVVVESSTDFRNWLPVFNGISPRGSIEIKDGSNTAAQTKFYRAQLLPE